MFVSIYCSRCGNRRRLSTKTTAHDLLSAIKAGWNSCGTALYCPKCAKTWHERNSGRMAGDLNTASQIASAMVRSLETRKTPEDWNGYSD